MDDSFDLGDIKDILAGMSAHTLVLRALLRANPQLARQIRAFAEDFEQLSRGVDDPRSARVMQEDLLQITNWLDESK